MIKPSTPKNEKQRLATLRGLQILDTEPEERFDRLTRMAKRMFQVPIALVSFVDDNRQWFKSCIGITAKETSREISFCGHAINADKVFIIPDALKDKRFADNPLVVNEPYIRFYVGCPIIVNNYRLGTLCIIDHSARTFDDDDIELIKDLASMVENELKALQLATIDELTGISNRRGFIQLAQHSLNLCLREENDVVLIFIDLDNFKPINDEFGHAEGDLALVAFAKLIKNTFRSSDVFARLGGDEFVILLSNTSQSQGEKITAKLNKSLTEYNQKTNRGYTLSFSFGIKAFNRQKHQTIEELLADGDSLMYQLKKHQKIKALKQAKYLHF